MVDLYGKLDDGIMYGVNKAVHAWNWTTGRPKEDLANISLGLGGIAISNSFLEDGNFPFAVLSALVCIPAMKTNYWQGTRERELMKKGLKCPKVEKLKSMDERMGPVQIIFGLYGRGMETSLGDDSHFSTGFFLYAAQSYIMRADPLPPRKNVLSRAKDKISEALKTRAPMPMPGPAMVPIPLEQRLNFI